MNVRFMSTVNDNLGRRPGIHSLDYPSLLLVQPKLRQDEELIMCTIEDDSRFGRRASYFSDQ
jgi:hypothetical protein